MVTRLLVAMASLLLLTSPTYAELSTALLSVPPISVSPAFGVPMRDAATYVPAHTPTNLVGCQLWVGWDRGSVGEADMSLYLVKAGGRRILLHRTSPHKESPRTFYDGVGPAVWFPAGGFVIEQGDNITAEMFAVNNDQASNGVGYDTLGKEFAFRVAGNALLYLFTPGR